ncbi:MAG TPA: DUF86 domain-containing protein [Thermoanaerobaculia bacterium]|nr:DUF86 domain-containing protein [Thermoanaerobaculia bacterium]
MSKHSDVLYLGHMLDYARRAHAKAAGMARMQFESDEDLQIILAHRIQVIGEAATRVSKATREAHPEIPWAEIAGMRHRIVHDYTNIDLDVVWETATERLPDLIAALEKFTPPEPPSA